MKKSTQVAVGGITSALCLLLMFMTGLVPFATYALPAIAGAILIIIVIENGYKTATMIYIAVSILSVFISPDKEAAMTFIVFFGYYPILKGKIEKLRNRPFELLVKFSVFNLATICSYTVVANVFGFTQILEGMNDMGQYSMYILLAMGNFMFFFYDIALSNLILIYVYKFRPKYIGRS